MSAGTSEVTGLLQPGQIIRPMVKPESVPDLVKKLFGLSVMETKELNSYDDKNFHVKVHSQFNNPHIDDVCPHGYVLKIVNSMDTKNVGILDAQNEAILHLYNHGLNVPKPVKNLYGTYMKVEKLDISTDKFVENNVSERPSGEHMVRLLTFVPGKILHQVPYTPQLFFESGQYVANINIKLMNLNCEALKTRKLVWMLENVPELSKFLFAVKDEGHRKMIMEILDAWNAKVVPVVPKLEKGMIHGDFNEQNIIVNTKGDDKETFHVDGILDFGDIHYACYVFEIAIAIMYEMVEVRVMPPNDAGGHLLAGYLTKRKIQDDDWNVLKECVAARFAQSLVMGAYSYELDPGNDYVIVTAKRGWTILSEFWNTPKEDIIARWKEIIKTYER